MTAALALRHVSVSYDTTPALVDLGLELAPGEVLALLGSSGSGKTTLLHTVAGFIEPDSGVVELGGRVVSGLRAWTPPERRRVGLVFQGAALWPHLTVLDTVAYPIRRGGIPRAAARVRAAELLERLGLAASAEKLPAQLSGGEQQRVGLARALARDPDLFLFDEPTAHLDTHLRSVVLDEIARRRESLGAAALYATHNAAEALAIADRIAVLRGGRLVQLGSPREIYEQPVDAPTARLTGPASFLERGSPGDTVMVRPDWVRLDGDQPRWWVESVRFRGTHTDLTARQGVGRSEERLLVTSPGPPRWRPGDSVGIVITKTWSMPSPGGSRSSEDDGLHRQEAVADA